MIPNQNIIAWSKVAPWSELRQIEQDLIIARAIVEIFSDPFLREELRFRGGTALNKLHFPEPLRYSEDIDLARTKEGPSKPIWDGIHALLDPWLGEPEFFRSAVAPALRYTVLAEDGTQIRLKIEINKIEVNPLDAPQSIPFAVHNPWFTGSAEIPAFSAEETLATKIRALLQRNKGRDLLDLSHSLDVFPSLDLQRTIDMFVAYMKEKPVPRWEAEKRMFEKLERAGFLADVHPLLSADAREKFDAAAGRIAFRRVFDELISRIPGKQWATTTDFLKRHGMV
jgi:predicted nucleotidyltransferase component of viral defense system